LPGAGLRGKCTAEWLIRDLGIYLTDFQNRTFSGEIAIFGDFRGGKKRKSNGVYHARVNYAVPNSRPAVAQ
jgi:hypothetical protein